MAEAIFFYLFSALMLSAAALVVFSRQPIYSVLSLLVTMFCLAALFVMLGAYFVAALQILLYAGAVLVLFLFVIMLLNIPPDTRSRWSPRARRAAGLATSAVICAQLGWIALRAHTAPAPAPLPEQAATVEALARQLFTTYLLPFELTSFLILVAIIAAVSLARGLWKSS